MSPQSVALHDLSLAQTHHKSDGTPVMFLRQTGQTFECRGFSVSLNPLVENVIITWLLPRRPASAQTSGGNDGRIRTRVAGAAGAPAAGTPRPGRGHYGLGYLPRLRPYPDTATQEAEAHSARQDPPHRRPADTRHHCVVVRPRLRSAAQAAGRTFIPFSPACAHTSPCPRRR